MFLKAKITSPNRIVCANRLFGGLGSVRLGRLKAPTPHSTTFFCARKNALHFSLSGAKKRRIQPKRYTKTQFDFNIYIRFKYFLFFISMLYYLDLI
jgi:hypothetical protein